VYNWWPGVSWVKSFPEIITGKYSDSYYKPFYEIRAHLPQAINMQTSQITAVAPAESFFEKSIKFGY